MPIGAAEPEWRALRTLEERFTPEFARRIERALRVPRRSPLSQLALAHLERGDLASALNTMRWLELGIELDREVRPMFLLLQHAGVTKLGLAGTGSYRGRLNTLAQSFVLTNPEAVKAAALRAADLVTAVTDETRAAIRGVIERGQRGGATVREMARDIRQLVGLNRPQAIALQNYRTALEGRGLSPTRVDALVAQRTAQTIKYRAETIARTETIRSSNEGQRALWQQAVADGILEPGTKQVWVAAADACPICRALDGRTVMVGSTYTSSVKFGGPGEKTVVTPTVEGPPAHVKCKCALALELEAAA